MHAVLHLLLLSGLAVGMGFMVVPVGRPCLAPVRIEMRKDAYATYLDRMVARKKVEVDNLLRRHNTEEDPLVMRMSYMASENLYNVTKSVQLDTTAVEDGDLRRMSVMIDLKRRSPTVRDRRSVVEFGNAPKFAELLTMAGADGFLINTDDVEYGGRYEDLKACSDSIRLKAAADRHPPVSVYKDIIIHPVQIAQALDNGAGGVLLIVAVVGCDLETLLDACTIMGVEAVVEVHTPNELDFALSKGATIFLVNCWDRTTGELFPEQAKGLASMMPMNAVALAAGDIHTVEQAAELSFYGYDGIVLGRGLANIPDVKQFIEEVHGIRAPPRGLGMGMKGLPFKGKE